MSKNLQQLLNYARTMLDKELFPEREEELVRILDDVFGISRYEWTQKNHEILPEDLIKTFEQIIQQRKNGTPLAYILGYSYFYHHKFPVSPQTLIPRYDTENLVEEVRKTYPKDKSLSILDIGTGTGAIALSLSFLFPNSIIKGIDIYDEPFKNSQQYLNVSSTQASVEKIDFLDQSQWDTLGMWDCIVSNPPYLDELDMTKLEAQVKDFEPHTALYAEQNGMAFYQAIAEFTKHHLNPNGYVFLEIDHKYKKVVDIFQSTTMKNYKIVNDLAGLPRVMVCEF